MLDRSPHPGRIAHHPDRADAPLSVADYLQGEQTSPIRHEYVASRVYAMAGAGEVCNRIARNPFCHLRAPTRGTPCAVCISVMKLGWRGTKR